MQSSLPSLTGLNTKKLARFWLKSKVQISLRSLNAEADKDLLKGISLLGSDLSPSKNSTKDKPETTLTVSLTLNLNCHLIKNLVRVKNLNWNLEMDPEVALAAKKVELASKEKKVNPVKLVVSVLLRTIKVIMDQDQKLAQVDLTMMPQLSLFNPILTSKVVICLIVMRRNLSNLIKNKRTILMPTELTIMKELVIKERKLETKTSLVSPDLSQILVLVLQLAILLENRW